MTSPPDLRCSRIGAGARCSPRRCGSSLGDDELAGREGAAPNSRRTPSASAEVWAVGDGADGGDDARRVAEMIARAQARPAAVPRRRLRRRHAGGVREQLPARVRPLRHDRGAHARQPRLAATARRATTRTGKAAGLVTRTATTTRSGPRGWEILSLNSESGLRGRIAAAPLAEAAVAQARHVPDRLLAPAVPERRPHGDQEDTAPLWRAVRGRAALVLNGHDHNIQHFKRRDGIVS